MRPKVHPKLRAFDFCGTLVSKKNTTKCYLEFLHDRGVIGSPRFYWFWVLAKCIAVIRPKAYMPTRIKCLKNIPVDQFDAHLRDFVSTLMPPPSMQDTVSTISEQDCIISYGLTRLILFWCEYNQLSTTIIASDLESQNDVLTGRYERYLEAEGKLSAFQSHLRNAELASLQFFTDDAKADKDLVDAAQMTCLI